MGRKCKAVFTKICDKCGREEVNGKPLNMVFRCIGCGVEHCYWCMSDEKDKWEVTMETMQTGKVIYFCHKCKTNPPLHIKAIHAVVERIVAFDKESYKLEAERANKRKSIVAEIEGIEDINSIVSEEEGE